ncbi:MAG: LCP family protein [Acidimicrobiia bacterium]|nr:LCP family protein [Acidimicrobiia bacterium]
MSILEFIVLKPVKAGVAAVLGIVLGFSAFYAFQLSQTFNEVAVEEFDIERARGALSGETPSEVTFVEPDNFEPLPPGVYQAPDLDAEAEALAEIFDLYEPFDPVEFSPYSFPSPVPDDVFDAYLMIGTDLSGYRADAVILGLQPTAGGNPIMVSLPRDLYVWNVCKGTFTRLNAGLGGCSGVASGPEMMAILVQDFTGIKVDHLAIVDFKGFEAVVDALGGTTVCVSYPTRDVASELNIEEAGCHAADGEMTLAWVRSRKAEHLIDGEWKLVGGSDFTRQARQRDVLFQLAGKAAAFPSPGALTERLQAVARSVRLDSGWTFGQALSTAWRYRGISKSSVSSFVISVRNYRTPAGAAVLLPTRYFRDQLESVYALG